MTTTTARKKPIPHFVSTWAWLWHTLKFIVYVIAQALTSLFQRYVIWTFTGTGAQVKQSRLAQSYARSAHVLRIVFRFRYDWQIQLTNVSDFILSHECFTDPEYVLRDNVDVYAVDKDKVVFTEAEEGVQQWRHEYGAFHRVAQFQQAVRVIILPMHAAKRLTDELGDTKARFIFITNTTRCGSTLLCRFFENTGRCVVFSEPAVDFIVDSKRRNKSQKFIDSITAVTMRLYCKPTRSPASVEAYVFKLTPVRTQGIVPILHRAYPHASFLLNYRHVMDVAKSLRKFASVTPIGRWNVLLAKTTKAHAATIRRIYEFDTGRAQRLIHPLEIGVFLWSCMVADYLRTRHQLGIDIVGCRYEDIVDNPRQAVESIFLHTGIPTDLVDVAMLAMHADSQAGSGIATNELDKYADCDVTPDIINRANEILRTFDLPISAIEDIVLESTITNWHVSKP